jgi:ubiquinone/menaquinone biosynthesis C-methylase UbiE
MSYTSWENFAVDEIVATSPFSEKVLNFIPQGGRVLDLGCGNGRILKLLKGRGYACFGIDINKRVIDRAQNDPDLSFVQFSVQNAAFTNFQDNFFDAIIDQAMLACVESNKRAVILKEVHRVLKSNGIISIVEFGRRPDRIDEYKNDVSITGEYGTHIVRREDGSEWFRVHNFDEIELENLIQDSNFEIVCEAHPNFLSLKGNPHPGHEYIAKKV